MNEDLRNILDELIGPPGLTKQFLMLLEEKGLDIKQSRDHDRAKYFFVTNGDKKVIVLAHESSNDGWWGIGGSLIASAMEDVAKPENNLTDWGAALINKKPDRGYWVSAEAILELRDIDLIRLDSQNKYHFNRNVLQAQEDLAPPFATIETFLRLSGLEA